MIPTIEEIIKGLLNKKISYEQAEMWINQHINNAVERANIEDLRDMFAAHIMGGFASKDGFSLAAATQNSEVAYIVADRMIEARGEER